MGADSARLSVQGLRKHVEQDKSPFSFTQEES